MTGDEPCVYVVMAVRNRLALTHACLESLSVQSYPAVRVVVVDDRSSDGTPDAIAVEFPEAVVLRGNGELWWTGATALGVEWVLERCDADDCILTLNNDTTVAPDYIETLMRVLREAGGRALVGSVALDSRDRDTISDGGPHLNWLTAKGGSYNSGLSLAEIVSTGVTATHPDVLAGRGTLIPTQCFRSIGNFNASALPHYAADYEFSARAARAGYALLMSYEAPVYSVVDATGVSTRRGPLPWRDFFAMFFSRRSPACLLYRWRFGRLAAPMWLRPAFLVADTARVLGGGLRDQLRGRSRCT